MNHHKSVLLCAVCLILVPECGVLGASKGVVVSGELKKWHTITITFTGPNTGEESEPNPFLDYRLNVTFTKGKKQYVVPGYYAADGDSTPEYQNGDSTWSHKLCHLL